MRIPAFAALAALLVSCGGSHPSRNEQTIPTPAASFERLDLSSSSTLGHITGLARKPGGNFILLTEGGLVEVTHEGVFVGAQPFGERGLTNLEFTDIAVLDGGALVLAAADRVLRYENDTLVDWFCVEPSIEPTIILLNRALTVDEKHGRIITAPAWFDESGELINAWHSHYRNAAQADRVVHQEVAQTHVVARGLAFDESTDHIIAVEEGLAHVFDLDGELLRSFALVGVEDAASAFLDGDRLVVFDASDEELRAFELR